MPNNSKSRIVKECIQKLAGTFGKTFVKVIDCNIDSVNVQERTCVVSSLDSSIEGLTVRLMLDVSDGDLDIPTINTTVSVAFTDVTEPFIVKCTWLDGKRIIVGNQGWYVLNNQQVFNDGSYGGWIKVKDPSDSTIGLLIKINNLENLVNKLIIAVQTTTIVLAPSGTYPLTTNPNVADLNQISPLTSESDLTNPSITHGKEM